MNGADGDGLVLVECSGNEFEGICLGGGRRGSVRVCALA